MNEDKAQKNLKHKLYAPKRLHP